jgi:hypothetical protein
VHAVIVPGASTIATSNTKVTCRRPIVDCT